ncbi:phosphomannomutase/phosphoglucomutase, partial [Candidatus Woesearchaeota archaeon]|nr:phosphomannomutase/phosphoglucomutase [Candidatus Woesearchaeota archaeon]
KEGPKTILYDLRSTKRVREIISENKGKPVRCRVGHAFIKEEMRRYSAVFAGELSGHYYFKDNSTAESSLLACIHVLNILSNTTKPLSEIAGEVKKYNQSGELNFEVKDKDEVISKVKEYYKDYEHDFLDGITIDLDTWWFNIRASNTEPYLRLNIEADNDRLLREKTKELMSLIEKQ